MVEDLFIQCLSLTLNFQIWVFLVSWFDLGHADLGFATEVHLFPEYSINSWLTREFGEDNPNFMTVVREKKSCYHFFIPTSSNYTVGVNLLKFPVGYNMIVIVFTV